MPALLAGKPPFATDERDSIYADPHKPAPRIRTRRQNTDGIYAGGPRESSYTAFDSYYANGGTPDLRNSGVGDIGRGLMTMGSYDDDTDNESKQNAKHNPVDKHRALYDAAVGAGNSRASDHSLAREKVTPREREKHVPPPLHPSSTIRSIKQPQPVVHTRPQDLHLSHYLEPSTPPEAMRSMAQQQQLPPKAFRAPGGSTVATPTTPHFRQAQPTFARQGQELILPPLSPSYGTGNLMSPSSRAPQQLPPPQTPITPFFARPRKETPSITFSEKPHILRGNTEETLLPRGGGGKGDEFWRRFSIVARQDAYKNSEKSAWLTKTENGTTRLSKWVWILGITLLLLIGGGIGVAWFLTHNKPAAQPLAIGGSANEKILTSAAASPTTDTVKPTKVTAAPASTATRFLHRKREGRTWR